MKKKKILISAIAIILLAVLIFASVMLYHNSKATIRKPVAVEHTDWMKYLSDSTLLKEAVIPGSHDSGTKNMVWPCETQNLTVKQQLSCGIRYFDIRIQKTNKDYVIFHGPLKGGSAKGLFFDIGDFLANNPTETVILDFQHFKNGAEQGVIEFIESNLFEYLLHKDIDIGPSDFINGLTIGEARGKCLVFWGSDEFLPEKDYVFIRNNDEGTRKGSVLQSYYSEEYNALSSADYVEKGLPRYISMYREQGDGLFVLQGQLTDGWRIRGPKFREAGNNSIMSEYIRGLKDSQDLAVINIIMRDYVNYRKTGEIIILNLYKGNIDIAAADEFTEKFGEFSAI